MRTSIAYRASRRAMQSDFTQVFAESATRVQQVCNEAEARLRQRRRELFREVERETPVEATHVIVRGNRG